MATSAAAYADVHVRHTSRMRWIVFGVTWLSYASYYLVRKPFSLTKDHIQDQYNLTTTTLGWIDFGYLAAYAVGQFVWGWLGDRIGPRRMLTFGMLATTSCTVAFGLSDHILLFGLFWSLNGLAQATGWSSNVKAMTLWFGPKGRGSVMGLWATCYQFGGLVANPIGGWFLLLFAMGAANVPSTIWSAAYFGPAFLVASVAVLVFTLLPDVPEPAPEAKADASRERREARAQVIRTPLVWALGASYFFMKLVRYALLFWLKYFLGKKGLQYAEWMAITVPLAFEAGGTLGSISIGAASDRLFKGKRLGVGIACLVVLAILLPFYGDTARLGVGANVAILAVIGFFLFGPDTLLSATAAQDLGGPAAASTAAGFINGVGSIGPVVGAIAMPAIKEAWGWNAAFASLGVGALFSASILLPFWWRQRRQNKSSSIPDSAP